MSWQDSLRTLIREVELFPGPVVALIEGGVWGGACELVFACDMVVATPEASFAATPAKLGVPYNVTGLLTFLNVAPPHIAKEMLFTGRPMTAAPHPGPWRTELRETLLLAAHAHAEGSGGG